jgi:hypothetical protein
MEKINEITHIEMNVKYLANFLFKDNINNIKISLFSEELKDSKNLFYFFLDLFFKGIVILYGVKYKNKSSVELNQLNYEQIENIRDKMKLAYIKLNFFYYHYTTIEEGDSTVLERYKMSNMEDIKNLEDNLDLKKYIFKLTLEENIYNISFEMLYDI